MSPRTARPRGNGVYKKVPLGHDALLARLTERGLVVADRDRALRYLRHIGYYRFSPYLIPFREDPRQDPLRPGTSFDDVLALYVFDRRLRLLVLDAIERIEVAVRAGLTDHMSVVYDDAFWYSHPEHFKDRHRHENLLRLVRTTIANRLSTAVDEPTGDGHPSGLAGGHILESASGLNARDRPVPTHSLRHGAYSRNFEEDGGRTSRKFLRPIA